MPSGIYKITCEANGKFYVGSAVNIQKRWQTHRSHLKMNRHVNKHLQNAWNKYGEKTFKFSVVEQTLPEKLIEAEQRWIDAVSPDVLFNICLIVGSTLGIKWEEERRQKIIRALTGRKLSKEAKQQMSESRKGRASWNKGISASNETRAKMSASRQGKSIHTENSRRKIANANHYRVISDETRRKISESKIGNTYHTGHFLSAETKSKIGNSNRGKKYGPFTDEHRKNMSNAAKCRWALKRSEIA